MNEAIYIHTLIDEIEERIDVIESLYRTEEEKLDNNEPYEIYIGQILEEKFKTLNSIKELLKAI